MFGFTEEQIAWFGLTFGVNGPVLECHQCRAHFADPQGIESIYADNTGLQQLFITYQDNQGTIPTVSDPNGAPLTIGEDVTIGHHVNLHGCTIGDEVLIGIGSIVMDRVVIEPRVLVGAGSLVPPGKVLKSGHLYLGRPVKEVRPLNEDELAHLKYSAEHYVRVMNSYTPG